MTRIKNTYALEVPSYEGARVCLLAVLTVDTYGLKAVYVGATTAGMHLTDVRAEVAEWVANQGCKQSYKQALCYFPGLEAKEYRS